MADGDPKEHSLFEKLRSIGLTLGALLQNRLRLFSVELEEQKLYTIEFLLCAALVFTFLFVGLITATAALVVIFWDHGGPFILAGFALVYLIGSFLCFRALKKRLTAWPRPFETTIEELNKDKEWLQPKN
ncbi:MAG: phage holin family protein [Verrucomicrobia bacterium]|nr:phage holin family protein [Verrucomicrobiota bacterium]MCF7709324.1 phage holin family protein [Verrucomicrobiota bacterium]